MGFKDLPSNEKPREKLMRYGVDTLSNVELITIIIGSGTRNNSAMDVAYNLIRNKGLLSLSHIPYEEYMKIAGIKKAKALMLTSIFELYRRLSTLESEVKDEELTSYHVYIKVKDELKGLEQEVLGAIVLDKDKKTISEKIIYKGTKDYIKVSTRDILKFLVLKDGKYFYIYHNHPDGTLYPSEDDIVFTEALIKEAKRYDYLLLDHIIVTDKGYFSFASGDPYFI